MSKKVVIKENNLDETEEPSQETIEENEPTETPMAAPRQRQQLQKAEGRTRMRELYKCDFCNKFLTKKSLNYSHAKYCKGQQPEKQEEPSYQEPPQEVIQCQPQLSLMEQIRQQRIQAKRDSIARLTQYIV